MEQPKADSELLLADILICDRGYLIAHDAEVLGAKEEAAFRAAVERRCTGVPMQYIRGRQEFWGRDFLVNPDVLIPRPESELLVENALRIARSRGLDVTGEQPLIADVATGSGCLAVSLALELPRASLAATDICESAIAVAKRNAEKHKVLERIVFLVGNLGEPLRERFGAGAIDMILCNPPYGALEQKWLFEQAVLEFEPHRALFGGPEGTEAIAALIPQAWELLRPQGYLIMEIGMNQSENVAKMLDRNWEAVEFHADLQGIPRCLVARKRCRKPVQTGEEERLA
jgi:release factor glutamine methyltransferase